MDWWKVRDQFEKEMGAKLRQLPGHREVTPELLEFRSIISHELPETAPTNVFAELIQILLQGKPVDLPEVKRKYFQPQLALEKEILGENKEKFAKLKKSAIKWVKENLPEEKLQNLWEEHKTWLPRRYIIYENKNTPFEIIAVDTLTRYSLIKKYDR